MKLLLIAAVTFMSLNLFSKEKRAEFSYETEMCACKGFYNPNKVSEGQLNSILKLYGIMPLYSEKTMIAFRENFSDFNQNYVEKEIKSINDFYSNVFKEYKQLDLPPVPKLLQVRDHITAYCDLNRHILVQIYNIVLTGDPTMLSAKNNSQCDKYRESLKKNKLDQVLSEFAVEYCKTNLSPKKCQQSFTSKPNQYAKRASFASFGWGNCMRRTSTIPAGRGEYHPFLMKTLDSYLTDKTCECDEP